MKNVCVKTFISTTGRSLYIQKAYTYRHYFSFFFACFMSSFISFLITTLVSVLELAVAVAVVGVEKIVVLLRIKEQTCAGLSIAENGSVEAIHSTFQ